MAVDETVYLRCLLANGEKAVLQEELDGLTIAQLYTLVRALTGGWQYLANVNARIEFLTVLGIVKNS
jgi:hypothetical protein